MHRQKASGLALDRARDGVLHKVNGKIFYEDQSDFFVCLFKLSYFMTK